MNVTVVAPNGYSRAAGVGQDFGGAANAANSTASPMLYVTARGGGGGAGGGGALGAISGGYYSGSGGAGGAGATGGAASAIVVNDTAYSTSYTKGYANAPRRGRRDRRSGRALRPGWDGRHRRPSLRPGGERQRRPNLMRLCLRQGRHRRRVVRFSPWRHGLGASSKAYAAGSYARPLDAVTGGQEALAITPTAARWPMAGAGSAVSLLNDVAGDTNGRRLVLIQRAYGGRGGASYFGNPGAGGYAYSEFKFDDSTSRQQSASGSRAGRGLRRDGRDRTGVGRRGLGAGHAAICSAGACHALCDRQGRRRPERRRRPGFGRRLRQLQGVGTGVVSATGGAGGQAPPGDTPAPRPTARATAALHQRPPSAAPEGRTAGGGGGGAGRAARRRPSATPLPADLRVRLVTLILAGGSGRSGRPHRPRIGGSAMPGMRSPSSSAGPLNLDQEATGGAEEPVLRAAWAEGEVDPGLR